jgi:hypothetical protein
MHINLSMTDVHPNIVHKFRSYIEEKHISISKCSRFIFARKAESREALN